MSYATDARLAAVGSLLISSASTPNIFSGAIFSRSVALRFNSLSASVAVPMPIALSPIFLTIFATDLSIFSMETPPRVAMCWRICRDATVVPTFAASLASVSTVASPFFVSRTIAPTAMAPIAAPNRAAFFAMLIKPTASLRMVCRTPSIFLSNEDVRAFTLINIFPTVATISPLLSLPFEPTYRPRSGLAS